MAKTWQEKFNNGKVASVEKLDKAYGGMQPGDLMLISTPAEIDAYIQKIPKGKTVTMEAMRRDLAHQHNATGTCPLTTGIFTRIVSEVALEKMAHGEANVTPFWRVVDPTRPLAKKLSCGPDRVAELRAAEA